MDCGQLFLELALDYSNYHNRIAQLFFTNKLEDFQALQA